MNPELEQVLKAAHYAAQKHAAQKRKGAAAEPYVNHLIEVAYLVSQATSDPIAIAAALLHDTVEDAGVTEQNLIDRFGSEVAAVVMEVTDDKSLPKAERKRLQIQNAPHKSSRAQLIKLADKISNLRSILSSPPTDWDSARIRQYFDWARDVVNGLSSPNPHLLAEFQQTYRLLPN